MSTALNDRDAILQAASVRIINPKNASILMSASTSLFHLNAAGDVDVPAITITATLIGLEGDVTFTVDGAALTSVTGKTAVVRYEDMQGPAAIVTARILAGGQTFSQSCIIGVVRDGAGGSTTYTWVKYADGPNGEGLSDNPTGKSYIGLAYNKGTPVESTVPSIYTWSLIKGTDGQPGGKGADGATLYTWIKYSDSSDGSAPYDTPNAGTAYLGLAVNKPTSVESSNPADYVWSKFRGADGVSMPGTPGARGAGQYYAGGSAWSDGTANAATPGDNVVNDVVTISNGGTYAMTKRWDGSAWNAIGAVFDGSLFVTGSINGAALKVGTVEIRKPDGTLILGAGGTLAAEAAAPGTKNSEIVVGGRNLFPDGDFERGIHTLSGAGYDNVNLNNSVGAISGTKSLFMQGVGADMFVVLGTRASVTPGKEYRISFYSKSATEGVITGSSSFFRLWNSSGAAGIAFMPIDGLGVQEWKRQVVAWTCPPGVTQIEPRFGIYTNGKYSWLAIDCLQIEEGNTVTQWTSALEDIAADAQAKADDARNRAYGAAVEHTNNQLAAKLNKGGEVLGGIFTVDTVTAPAGFRAGTIYWNTAGDYVGGYGTAMTPKGLIGYNASGKRTFMVNGGTGDIQIRGALMGGAYEGFTWPAGGAGGFILAESGLLMGNYHSGRYIHMSSDGGMNMPGFSHENGQLTLTNTIIVTPRLRTDFFITVPNLYLNSQVNTNSYQQFALSATLNNGTGPYRYNWSFQMEEGDIAMGADPSNTNGIVRSRGTNRVCSGFLTCTVTDANGATHSDSGYIRIQFGSGVPV